MPSVAVALVPSISNPSKTYRVTWDSVTGAVACSCPSQRNPCPHIALLIGTFGTVQAAPQVVAAPVQAPKVAPAPVPVPEKLATVTPIKPPPAPSPSGKPVPAPPAPWMVFLGWVAIKSKDGTITEEPVWSEEDDSAVKRYRLLEID